MLDTSVAIHLRDGDDAVRDRVVALDQMLVMSIITQIELLGGLRGVDELVRRQRMDQMLTVVDVIPFGPDDAAAYGDIISAVGFSRRKAMDRMIAAQAIVAEASLITLNGADFRDIPALQLVEW